MLDMAFQLLAFFIIMYRPSALEGQIALSLPAAGEAKAATEMDVDPNTLSDTDVEPPADLTVVVKTRQGADKGVGSPSSFMVESLQGSSTPMKDLKELSEYLQRDMGRLKGERDDEIHQLQARAKEGALKADERKRLRQLETFPIKLNCDSQLRYEFVAEVMDACSRAGFNSVAFAPPPDLATPGD
jgi:biopolymer transport protein ExbD